MELPKNVRQIGENNTDYHIYIEDYVITYLYQMAEETASGSKAIALLGKVDRQEQSTYYYIFGAIASRKKRIEDQDHILDEEEKAHLLGEADTYFKGLSIVGWAVIESEFNRVREELLWGEDQKTTAPEGRVLCKMMSGSREQKWCVRTNDTVCQVNGYTIFYDQNEVMQNYLILWHKENQKNEEQLDSDHAANRFRQMIAQQQSHTYGRNPMPFFYIICVLLLLMVSAIGITTINRYDKMIEVENSMVELAQAMKESEAADVFTESPIEQKKQETKAEASIDQQLQETVSDAQAITDASQGEEVQTGVEERPGVQDSQGDNGTQEATEPNTEQQPQDKESPGNPEVVATDAPASTTEQTYIVQEGDTLAQISYQHYHTVKKVQDICQLNQIQNPDSIITGEKILLP